MVVVPRRVSKTTKLAATSASVCGSKQAEQADLELARVVGQRVGPGVLPLGVGRGAHGAARGAAEAEAVGGDADGGELLELGRVLPVAAEVARRLLPVVRRGLGLDQPERDPVHQADDVEARLALGAGLQLELGGDDVVVAVAAAASRRP